MSTMADTPERIYEWRTRLLLASNKGSSGGLGCQRLVAPAGEEEAAHRDAAAKWPLGSFLCSAPPGQDRPLL